MTSPLILALLLGATAQSTEPPIKWASLSAEEKRFAEGLAVHADACADQECRDETFGLMVDIIRLRRSAYGERMSDVTLSQLKRSCDKHRDNLRTLADCLSARQKVSFEEGMKLAGYTQAGITGDGYSQIRIGMEMREVEHILADFGEEMSYAASGGYSASVYQWTAGRRIIVVSFSDYKVSGRSQSGLYRN